MNEIPNVAVTRHQRDLLLQGLRFVRSSVLLEVREPSPKVDEDRAQKLQEIATLVEQLEVAQPANAPVNI